MELYAELNKNFVELGKMFSERMDEYDKRLKDSTSSSSSTTPKSMDLSSLSREFVDFRALVWKSLAMLKAQGDLLLLGLDRHETSSRRKVLLVHGVPESRNSDVAAEVELLLKDRLKLMQFSSSDLAACHRLGTLRDKPRPILIRFLNYSHRCEVWRNKSALKGSGITVSEFLTRGRHETFLAARKHFGIHKCWTVDGKIIVSLPDNTRAKVERMAELVKLLKIHPQEGIASKPKPAPQKTTPINVSSGVTIRKNKLK